MPDLFSDKRLRFAETLFFALRHKIPPSRRNYRQTTQQEDAYGVEKQ